MVAVAVGVGVAVVVAVGVTVAVGVGVGVAVGVTVAVGVAVGVAVRVAVVTTVTHSYSAIQSLRQCEAQYYYHYVLHLQRKDRDGTRLDLGSVLHGYLERYYSALQRSKRPLMSKQAIVVSTKAWALTADEWAPKLKALADAAHENEQESVEAEYRGMLDAAARIAARYHRYHGEEDADEWEIVYVEHPVWLQLTENGRDLSYIDLLARNRRTGRLALWDHKSTQSVPDQERRITDLQTILYARKAEIVLDLKVDSIVWNYLRTKEPEEPTLLKAGGLSKDKRIDTTLEVYQGAIKRHGLDRADYLDMTELLAGREKTVYFPRYEMPIMAGEVLLRDYHQSALDAERLRSEWALGERVPVRSSGYWCKWCEYHPISLAAIMSGDEGAEDVIRMRYVERGRRSNGSSSGTSEDGDSATDNPPI